MVELSGVFDMKEMQIRNYYLPDSTHLFFFNDYYFRINICQICAALIPALQNAISSLGALSPQSTPLFNQNFPQLANFIRSENEKKIHLKCKKLKNYFKALVSNNSHEIQTLLAQRLSRHKRSLLILPNHCNNKIHCQRTLWETHCCHKLKYNRNRRLHHYQLVVRVQLAMDF